MESTCKALQKLQSKECQKTELVGKRGGEREGEGEEGEGRGREGGGGERGGKGRGGKGARGKEGGGGKGGKGKGEGREGGEAQMRISEAVTSRTRRPKDRGRGPRDQRTTRPEEQETGKEQKSKSKNLLPCITTGKPQDTVATAGYACQLGQAHLRHAIQCWETIGGLTSYIVRCIYLVAADQHASPTHKVLFWSAEVPAFRVDPLAPDAAELAE